MGKVVAVVVNVFLLVVCSREIAGFSFIPSCRNLCGLNLFVCSCEYTCQRNCCPDFRQRCAAPPSRLPCGNPRNIERGSYSPKRSRGYPHGSMITYKCNKSSYTTATNLKHTCRNGQWVPRNLPECPLRCRHSWTRWYDRDNPTGKCDCETLNELRKKNRYLATNCPSGNVEAIEAREIGRQLSHYTTSMVTEGIFQNSNIKFNTKVGFECWNRRRKSCKDYQVRLCCPPLPKRKCGKPKDVKRGSYSPKRANRYPHGFKITYKCNAGSVASSRKLKRTCIDGKWTPTYLPRCRRPVFAYCRPPNITSPLTCTPRKNIYYPHTTPLNCTCLPKYVLKGPKTISCIATNTWSVLPICVKPSKCRRPANPENGYIPFNGEMFKNGETITYVCDEGYKIVGKAIVTCQNGVWSHTPTCPDITCPNRQPPVNGKQDPSQNIWYPGDTVTYTSDKYYSINGISKSTCNDDGSWSSAVPTCQLSSPCTNRCTAELVSNLPCQCIAFCNPNEDVCCPDANICNNSPISPVQCAKLVSTPGQQIVANSSTAVYSCDSGFFILGNAVRHCRNGKWDGIPPPCIPESNNFDIDQSCLNNCNKPQKSPRTCSCMASCSSNSGPCCFDYVLACSLTFTG